MTPEDWTKHELAHAQKVCGERHEAIGILSTALLSVEEIVKEALSKVNAMNQPTMEQQDLPKA
jgi:hypothetical protein